MFQNSNCCHSPEGWNDYRRCLIFPEEEEEEEEEEEDDDDDERVPRISKYILYIYLFIYLNIDYCFDVYKHRKEECLHK